MSMSILSMTWLALQRVYETMRPRIQNVTRYSTTLNVNNCALPCNYRARYWGECGKSSADMSSHVWAKSPRKRAYIPRNSEISLWSIKERTKGCRKRQEMWCREMNTDIITHISFPHPHTHRSKAWLSQPWEVVLLRGCRRRHLSYSSYDAYFKNSIRGKKGRDAHVSQPTIPPE